MISLSLKIDNTYEKDPKSLDRETVTTHVTEEEIPSPPADESSDEYAAWVYQHVECRTGTGRIAGNAWYDVEVTACSDPALVGRTFRFGY